MRNFFLFITAAFCCATLQAGHIIGGIISYKVAEINTADSTTTLTLDLTMYRDGNSAGAFFDTDIEIGIYRVLSSEEYEVVEILSVSRPEVIDIEPHPLAPELFFQEGTYSVAITLEHGSDYLLAYQRCCRPDYITNLDEEELGMALQIEITAAALMQDLPSPFLTATPFAVAALNQTLDFQTPIAKADSVSIELGFSDLFVAGGPQMETVLIGCCDCVRPNPETCLPAFETAPFADPYSAENPFGSENDVILGSDGLFTGTMKIAGSYQYGVEILAYASGVLLSRQVLDYNLITAVASSTDNLNHDTFTVYPNPATDHLIIEGELDYPLEYRLTNIIGVTKQKGTLQDSRINVEVPPGVYSLQLKSKETHSSANQFVLIH